jgi:crossover junction endodeoxyribonuclease RusA
MLELSLPWPDRKLQSNASVRSLPQKTRLTKTARKLAWALSLDAKIKTKPDATIFIEYYPKAYRGDVHNVPTSLKAYIDGIADAMGCDDRKFVVDYPTQWAGKDPKGKIVFRIEQPEGVVDIELRGAINV